MDRNFIINKIKNDDVLLPLPQVVSRLLEITDSDNYSIDDLADIILKDSSLTAKVLQLSNSSFYNRGLQIISVNQAISMIGDKTVKCLALSTSVLNMKRLSSESGINSQDFFTYILSVAAAAESIAKIIKYNSFEEALIAGLLHDVGVIYLLNHFSRKYKEVLRKQSEGMFVHDAENEVFGIDHSELGFNLALSWKLPENIAKSIRDHHCVENLDEADVLGNIVKLSILLTFDQFSNSEEDIEKRLLKIGKLSGVLKIDSHQIAEITKNSLLRLVEISGIFGVEINDTEELLTRANREIWKSYLTMENLFKEREELNKKLIAQERVEAAMAAKEEALSTLSHYLNNAVMIISGQSQLVSMMKDNNQIDKLLNKIPSSMGEIQNSVDKIIAVMDVLKEISPLNHDEYFSYSKALNIDDRIGKRLKRIGTV